MQTPVAFFVFNRPDTTKKVFEAIRQAKPSKLLVIADGPRVDWLGEAEKCAVTRALINRVDWDCEVLKNYSEINMGCKRRISSGLDWVFNTVEEAIILEDDCLPDPSFFKFCEELLQKYRNDERIMMICGTNILSEWKSNTQSYHFSCYSNCWGWASWKRAWKHYDVSMKLWSDPKIKNKVRDIIADKKQYNNRKKLFDATYSGKIDTWDYQWLFARLSQSGLSIIPSVNLVSNIGFTEEATHTNSLGDARANLLLHSMSFPLTEPYNLAIDRDYNYRHYQKVWANSLLQRAFRKAKRLIASTVQ